MNHIDSALWNKAQGCVTSELGRSRSTVRRGAGAAGSAALPALTILAAALALPVQAALPTGLQLVAGSGTVVASDAQMTVQQGSAKMIVDWQSFNIGKNQSVIFNQPSKDAVALNRVVGNSRSAIDGQLRANGKVFLVNPNGVWFGQGAKVNVGGLIASTLDIANDNFLNGKYAFQGKGRAVQGGQVLNLGSIRADGVALLGGTVSNRGTIAAHLGSVALAAGNQVALDFAGDGLLKVQVNESALNALVENQKESTIRADGGTVLLMAHATNALLQTVVNNQGTIQARTVGQREGKIQLLGGFNGGTVKVAGRLDASAPQGNGGFIDTSGAKVQILRDTEVTTQAATGRTGNWLIAPTDLTISAGNAPATGIGAETLQANLARTNVTLQTVAHGNGKGDIHVNAPFAWSKNKLTLNAHGSINVNAVMTASGTAALEMNYGGYTAANLTAVKDTGVHMALSASGFTGRVDFTGKNAQGASTNQLKINGDDYTILTALGSEGSRTGQDLQGMQGNLNGRYALAANIDASATKGWDGGFLPVGGRVGMASLITTFTGQFDGLGHVIRDLHIDRPKTDSVGFFGIAQDATLRNVGLVGGSVTGKDYVGALAGTNMGWYRGIASIYNVYSTTQVYGKEHVGGLVGVNHALTPAIASISNAHFTGLVNGKKYVGGLAGRNYAQGRGTACIFDATSTAEVVGEEYVGGLVGENSAGGQQSTASIFNATFAGRVRGTEYVGGAVGGNMGSNRGTASISYTYSMAQLLGTKYVGGLVGLNEEYGGSASISYAYATGQTLGEEKVGGLVGENSGSIRNAYFDQDSTGQANAIGVNTGVTEVAEIDSSNRHQHASYAHLGDWTETASGSGVWEAKDTNDVVQWIMFEGSSRPFLASEYSTTIGNAHQLQLMAYKPDASYQLASDIDARATRVDAGNAKQHGGMWSSSGFVPVGDSAAKFTGSLNGQGHTISGLNIDRPKQHNVGLFGYAENAQLSHLGVEGNVKGIDHVGLLVGKNVADRNGTASIFDVMVSGQVTGLGNSVGGLVGSNRAKNGSSNQIDHVHAEAKVNAGTLHNGVALNGVGVGGLVGKNYAKNGSIVSINNAAVWTWATGGSNVGGLVGIQHAQNDSIARIDHAEVDAQMTGAANIGALIGTNIEASNSAATFENCFGQALTEKDGKVESVEPVGFNTSAP